MGKQTLLVSVKINTHLIYYRKETKCLFYSNGCTNFGNFLLILIHFMLVGKSGKPAILKKEKKKVAEFDFLVNRLCRHINVAKQQRDQWMKDKGC